MLHLLRALGFGLGMVALAALLRALAVVFVSGTLWGEHLE
jgi:hypothetical protein